jgi:hypothetical protein
MIKAAHERIKKLEGENRGLKAKLAKVRKEDKES